ncbi:MAG: rod shape-determining protein MreC [Fretibacterium sp.]|nr:rod shape-determining protein MreC [Fretibacterium sp.]
MFDRRQTREWVHGLTALILSLFLLGVSSNLGIVKGAADIVGEILAVPEYPAVKLRAFLGRMFLWAREKSELQDRIETLQRENAALRVTRAVVLNEQLKAELNARMSDVQVTMRAPLSWWNEVRLDKGEDEGVTSGLPLFQDGFLVGRVTSVGKFSSWAELLTSPSLMIPVVIEETRDLGVVVGEGNGTVLLTYVPVARGDLSGMNLSTALIGEQLPPGLPIGKVGAQVGTEDDGYATYRVKTGADLSRLYTLSLLSRAKDGAR